MEVILQLSAVSIQPMSIKYPLSLWEVEASADG